MQVKEVAGQHTETLGIGLVLGRRLFSERAVIKLPSASLLDRRACALQSKGREDPTYKEIIVPRSRHSD